MNTEDDPVLLNSPVNDHLGKRDDKVEIRASRNCKAKGLFYQEKRKTCSNLSWSYGYELIVVCLVESSL